MDTRNFFDGNVSILHGLNILYGFRILRCIFHIFSLHYLVKKVDMRGLESTNFFVARTISSSIIMDVGCSSRYSGSLCTFLFQGSAQYCHIIFQ